MALAVGVIMSQTLMVGGQSSPTAAGPTHKAQVNFGSVLDDTTLASLLDKHDAMMIGAYMTTEGFYGMHRAATSTDPAAFILSARAETAGGFSNGSGDGITTRARDFVREHTSQDVQRDAELQDRARSLLGLHARLDSAHLSAKGTSPLIYAAVVTGSESQLTALGGDSNVVDFEIATIDSAAPWSQPTHKSTGGTRAPISLGASDLHPHLSTLSSRKLSTE